MYAEGVEGGSTEYGGCLPLRQPVLDAATR